MGSYAGATLRGVGSSPLGVLLVTGTNNMDAQTHLRLLPDQLA